MHSGRRGPVDIYPGWLRITVSTAIPVGIAVTVPAKAIAGSLTPCRSRPSWLFADVRGSTPLSERLGPIRFAQLMSRFYATGVDLLARNDALIERFMGDRVVGYFFPGFAGPEHAHRAIETGLALLRATGNTSGGDPWIPVGIGLHTGTAYVGTVGEEMLEFTALGDEVVVPARLSDLAAQGELLATNAAFAASRLATDTGRREVALKGITTPVSVHVLRAS